MTININEQKFTSRVANPGFPPSNPGFPPSNGGLPPARVYNDARVYEDAISFLDDNPFEIGNYPVNQKCLGVD